MVYYDIIHSMFTQIQEPLHHAYFFTVENRTDNISLLLETIEKNLGFVVRGNPDCVVRHYDKWAIGETRELKEILLSRPHSRRLCIFSVGSILPEAQNALLKIFEDPPAQTHFFIISETDAYMLPTLRSRMSMHKGVVQSGKNIESDDVRQFIQGSLGERMVLASRIADDGNEKVRRFLDELEKSIYVSHVGKKIVLKKIIEAKEFLLLPSAHKKGLLEAIALSL